MEETEELKVSTVDRFAGRYSEQYRKLKSEHLSLQTADEHARERWLRLCGIHSTIA